MAGALLVVVLAVVDLWTLRAVRRLSSRRSWSMAINALLVGGVASGLWVGGGYDHQVAPEIRSIGFQIPALVLRLEDGRWTDYIGLFPVIVPFNALCLVSCGLLPITAGLLVRRWVIENGIGVRSYFQGRDRNEGQS